MGEGVSFLQGCGHLEHSFAPGNGPIIMCTKTAQGGLSVLLCLIKIITSWDGQESGNYGYGMGSVFEQNTSYICMEFSKSNNGEIAC